jgi:hypothetical protein
MTDTKYMSRPARRGLLIAGGLVLTIGLSFAAGSSIAPRNALAADTATNSSGAKPDGTKTWDFDHDRAQAVPQDWIVVGGGQWRVIVDSDAPSEPNVLGLPGYGLPKVEQSRLWVDSFFGRNYLLALPKDSGEYTDLSYEADIKPWGGAFGSYAGLVFRYADPQNYYVLVAACPKDYLALYKMSGGQFTEIKQVPAPLQWSHWYSIKIDAHGGHFTGSLDGKQILEADDTTLAKGRVGIWSQNDSRVNFDNLKVTPASSGS